MKKLLLVGVVVLLVGGSALLVYYARAPHTMTPIGGERDAHGCLVGGGYAYDEYVGACIRAFEMTSGIKDAARLAVQSVGQGYALTVVAFNSYEERGSYDIMLERGEERTKQTVIIRGGKVVSSITQQ